jgi:hypothetical protein
MPKSDNQSGRPSVDIEEKLWIPASTKLTKADDLILDKKVEVSGLSRSELIRRAILGIKVPPAIHVPAINKTMSEDLRKQGRLLNQIAKAINTARIVLEAPNLPEAEKHHYMQKILADEALLEKIRGLAFCTFGAINKLNKGGKP